MNRDFWRRSWEVYDETCQLPPPARQAYVESKLDDPAMRSQVLAMIEELEFAEQSPDGPQPFASDCSELQPDPSINPSLNPGDCIGRFVIKEQIGRGGMGRVYLAHDSVLDREVAIKVLSRGVGSDNQRITDGIVREARAASVLNHPNIVTVHEVVEFDGGAAIVMEFIRGRSLRTVCGTPARIAQIAHWGRQIADALTTAHAAGIIHRDIKPENIMIRPDDYVKILDFGLAKNRSGPVDILPLGTVRYMSPEQGRAVELTPASDVFSLGLVLYELATGVHPFAGPAGNDSTMTITQSMAVQPVSPPSRMSGSIPGDFDELVARMLAKDPSARPSASEVSDRLGKLIHAKRTWRDPRRIAAGALVIAGFAAVAAWYGGRPLRPPASLQTAPFTTYQGVATQPDFSADGSRIVFAWTGPDDTNQNIYWKSAGEDVPHRLTKNNVEDFNPVYSPDGKWIAFLRNPSADVAEQLVVIPAEGGAERVVSSVLPMGDPRGLTWWPDGQSLLVRDSVALNGTVMQIFLDGRKLPFSRPPDSQADGLPKVSPKGNRAAFLRYHTDGTEVCWTESSGEPVRCVARVPSVYGMAWHRTGEFLYYSDASALWRVGLFNRRGDQPVKIADGSFPWLASDPSSTRLAFSRTVTDANVWRIGRRGEGNRRFIASSGQDSEPVWSPDGSRVLIRSNRSGNYELYTYNADGTGERQITHFGASLTNARWSPDGAWIAFQGVRTAVDPTIKHHNIYVVPSSGGPFRRVTDDRYHAAIPAWSPDSKEIYYDECTVPHRMRKVLLTGGPSVDVGAEMSDLAISRDNNIFYYSSGVRGIFRRPVSGGPATLLATPRGLGLYNYWDVTSHGVYFVDGPVHPLLRYLDFATNHVETITELPNRLVPALRGLSVSPDEKSVVYTLNDISIGDILLITNLNN